MRRSRLGPAACGFCLLVSVAAPATESPFKEDAYRKALHATISLELTKASDGGKPTLELAVAWICKKAEVPYQTKRSRELCGDKVKVRISPINYTDVVAGRAIVALATQAGLVPKIDDDGVYLAPKPEAAEGEKPPPRQLTLPERIQLGATINVEVKVRQNNETQRGSWGDKTVEQAVRLEIQFRTSRSFSALQVVARVYGRIQKESLDWPQYDDEKRPRYGPDKEFIELHSETFDISGVPRMQLKELKTEPVSTAYLEDDWWYKQDYRYGERYYGYVVDFCVGEQVVKSIACPARLFELIGRDKQTGYPKQ
jgi:hypothetical protein